MSPVTLEGHFADHLVTRLHISRDGTYPQVDRTKHMASTRGLTDAGRRGAPAGSQLTSGADGGPASEAEHLRGLSQHLPPLTSLSRLYCPVPA